MELAAKTHTTVRTETLEDWHIILGHFRHFKILEMAKRRNQHGISISNQKWNGCPACELAKAKRAEIPKISKSRT